MAFTSTNQNSSSDAGPSIEILACSHVRHLRLYDKSSEDMTPWKGDLWKFEMNGFRPWSAPAFGRNICSLQ